jgi:hypothetical protein
MRRKLLGGLLVISATLAEVFGLGSFAAFNDQSVGTDTVTVIDVELSIDDETNDVFTLAFSISEFTSDDQAATDTVELTNGGDIPVIVTVNDVANVTGAEGTCAEPGQYTLSTTIADVAGDDGANGAGYIADGDSEFATVTLTLLEDAQGCQGASFEVTVTFTATADE